jgi:hypothetical protein
MPSVLASAGAALAGLAVLALTMLATTQVARCAADVSAKPHSSMNEVIHTHRCLGCWLTCCRDAHAGGERRGAHADYLCAGCVSPTASAAGSARAILPVADARLRAGKPSLWVRQTLQGPQDVLS